MKSRSSSQSWKYCVPRNASTPPTEVLVGGSGAWPGGFLQGGGAGDGCRRLGRVVQHALHHFRPAGDGERGLHLRVVHQDREGGLLVDVVAIRWLGGVIGAEGEGIDVVLGKQPVKRDHRELLETVRPTRMDRG